MMIVTMVAGAALAMTAQAVPGAANVDLFCTGRGDRYEDDARVPFTSAVRLRVAGGKGQALIPDAMLAEDDERGWHEVKGLRVDEGEIAGKITFNWLFSPVMTYDRDTRVLSIRGSLANFSGTCARYDAATSRMPVATPRRPKLASSEPYAGPVRPATGGDARARARAMAGAVDERQSAMKADLAFRLFNAGTVPITEFVMLGTSGAPSGNWLRPGERVAARSFRAMNFRQGTKCTHTVRVTFADQSRVVRTVNLCGKDVLYAGDGDAWAE